MARNRIDRARVAIKVVILWLVGVYIFEVVKEAHWFAGVGAVAVAVAVNVYARKKASASVETNLEFTFWLYLPVVLLFGLPLVFKLIIVYSSGEEFSWWAALRSVLPFLLKLGVPAGVLVWIYVVLGKYRAKLAD